MNLAKLLFELLHNTAGLEWIAYLLHVLQRSRSIGLLLATRLRGERAHGKGVTALCEHGADVRLLQDQGTRS